MVFLSKMNRSQDIESNALLAILTPLTLGEPSKSGSMLRIHSLNKLRYHPSYDI